MKNELISKFIVLLFIAYFANKVTAQNEPYKNPKLPIEERVND